MMLGRIAHYHIDLLFKPVPEFKPEAAADVAKPSADDQKENFEENKEEAKGLESGDPVADPEEIKVELVEKKVPIVIKPRSLIKSFYRVSQKVKTS